MRRTNEIRKRVQAFKVLLLLLAANEDAADALAVMSIWAIDAGLVDGGGCYCLMLAER